jgi:hypothetical protein
LFAADGGAAATIGEDPAYEEKGTVVGIVGADEDEALEDDME